MCSTRTYIGLDDTDAGDSIGTGALARELRLLLVRRFGVRSLGVTRHQLLVHPDIPYTSHNSAACLLIEHEASTEELAAASRELIAFLFHDGADPGLCLLKAGAGSPELLDFGRRAQREVLSKAAALELGRVPGVVLEELGGLGIGVIGALAACALRRSGDDGRFIALRGIRSVPDELTVAELCRSTPIERVVDEAGGLRGPDEVIHSNGWIRPDLSGGVIQLRLRRCGDHWEPLHRKRGGENDF